MDNKTKACLGGGVLLLVVAAIGLGMWLQHRAEQQREERKNAIYGYWMTENPEVDFVACIKIAKDELKLANMSITSPAADEVVASIDEDGNVTAEAMLSNGNKVVFMLDKNDPSKMSWRREADLSPLAMKKISKNEYDRYWGPLDLAEWNNKTGSRFFINDDCTFFLAIRPNDSNKVSIALIADSGPEETLRGSFAALTCQGQIIVFIENEPTLPMAFLILNKDTIRKASGRKKNGEIFHRLTPERYQANRSKILNIYNNGLNPSEQEFNEFRNFLDKMYHIS